MDGWICQNLNTLQARKMTISYSLYILDIVLKSNTGPGKSHFKWNRMYNDNPLKLLNWNGCPKIVFLCSELRKLFRKNIISSQINSLNVFSISIHTDLFIYVTNAWLKTLHLASDMPSMWKVNLLGMKWK